MCKNHIVLVPGGGLYIQVLLYCDDGCDEHRKLKLKVLCAAQS